MSARELPAFQAEHRPGVPAVEAMQGLPVAAPHRLDGARVTATTATTLRAALDLLLGETVPRRPLEVRWDDGALEVRCPVLQPEAMTLAAGLMETIEGSIGPPSAGERDWVLRAPVHGPQAMYLMLHQGTLAIAVPWHSVLRVRLARHDDIVELARREGSAVLPPFVSVSGKPEPRPAVLLGLGLKRAYLIADRLIWRMPAEPADKTPSESGGALGKAVRTPDGEVYWAVQATELMSGIETAPLPKGFGLSEPEPAPARAPLPPLPPLPLPLPAASAGTRPSDAPPLRTLEPGEVEPLGPPQPPPAPAPPPGHAAPATAAPAPSPGPAASAPAAPVPSPVRAAPARAVAPPRPLHALVAEDSIIGRIFLERLLQRRGFLVTSVGSARELEAELDRQAWDLVLADVELPDAGRADHLRRLANPRRWVALVRDREDERLALEAGVTLHLRKPFESDHLDRLLPLLGLGGSLR